MKTTADFIERLRNDEAFTNEIKEKVSTALENGSTDYTMILIDIGAEYGYEIDGSMITELNSDVDVLSEEELGKVSGGTLPIIVITGVSISLAVTCDLVQSIMDS